MDSIIYTSPLQLKAEPICLPFAAAAEMDALITGDGRLFPAQKTGNGVLALLTCEAGETLILTPVQNYGSKCAVVLEEDRLHMQIGGQRIGGYVWDTAFLKPYFGPLQDDEGHDFTRLDFETTEHKHHRSVFIAVGDVNGVDIWNEPPDCGIIRNEEIRDIKEGAAFASFTAVNRWTDHDGKPLIREFTTYTMYNQSDACRMLDIDLTFSADFGEVVFGATKEAGPLGIRMRDELRADTGSGMIKNSRGEIAEEQCWGHEAEWCDYAGDMPFGKMGITVFDHPDNERYPTTWHVRNYGLFAANNLYFKGGLTIPAGETLTYHFRILLRREEMSEEEIRRRYNRFINN